MFGEFTVFGRKKVWRMNRSAKGLLILTTTLDGFSLTNCRRFAKFTKFSTHQTFPLDSMWATCQQVMVFSGCHRGHLVTNKKSVS